MRKPVNTGKGLRRHRAQQQLEKQLLDIQRQAAFALGEGGDDPKNVVVVLKGVRKALKKIIKAIEEDSE